MDAQTSLEDTAALAALVQSLVRFHAEGSRRLGGGLTPEALAEDRFLAARDGMAAEFVGGFRGRRPRSASRGCWPRALRSPTRSGAPRSWRARRSWPRARATPGSARRSPRAGSTRSSPRSALSTPRAPRAPDRYFVSLLASSIALPSSSSDAVVSDCSRSSTWSDTAWTSSWVDCACCSICALWARSSSRSLWRLSAQSRGRPRRGTAARRGRSSAGGDGASPAAADPAPTNPARRRWPCAQERAFAFSRSNSPWSMVPLSSSCFARSISLAEPAEPPSFATVRT
jgi:hypothetical protein